MLLNYPNNPTSAIGGSILIILYMDTIYMDVWWLGLDTICMDVWWLGLDE
jgi:hypothetical protein